MRLSNVETRRGTLWETVPLSPYVLSLSFGIALSWFLGGTLPLWLCMSGMGASAAGVFLSFRTGARRPSLMVAAVILFFFFVGAALSAVAYRKTLVAWPAGEREWTARVWSVNKSYAAGAQADIETEDAPYKGIRVRATLQGTEAKLLHAGDRLHFSGAVHAPANAGNPGGFDYRAYLRAHGVAGTAYIAGGKWERKAGEWDKVPLSLRLRMLRDRMLEDYSAYFGGDEWIVLAALTLGERSRLTPEIRELFSDTGTSHILALSGLHLGILFSLIQGFARRFTRKPRVLAAVSLVAVAGLWLFVLLAGSPLSLCRAAWMLTLSQLCACFGRSSHPLNNLFVAAFFLLLSDPLSLFDVGFQLSFVSVFSIIAGYYGFWRRYRMPRWHRGSLEMTEWLQERAADRRDADSVARPRRFRWRAHTERPYNFVRRVLFPFFTTSVSAQIGTAPLVLYYFHTLAPYALLANCIVIPLAYVLLGGALCFFLLPGLRFALAWLLHAALGLMRGGLEAVAALPGAGLRLYPSAVTIAAATLCGVLLLSYLRQKRGRKLLAAALCVLVCAGVEGWRGREGRVPPRIIVYNTSRATEIHFVASAAKSYLYSTLPADSTWQRLSYIEQSYWQPERMARPQLLPAEYRDGRIFCKDGLMAFGPARVAVLHHTLPRKGSAFSPLPVTLLVVGRGCANTLPEMRRVYSPRCVVLDNTLGLARAARLRRECASQGLPCHDVRVQGALVLPLSGGEEEKTVSHKAKSK